MFKRRTSKKKPIEQKKPEREPFPDEILISRGSCHVMYGTYPFEVKNYVSNLRDGEIVAVYAFSHFAEKQVGMVELPRSENQKLRTM